MSSGVSSFNVREKENSDGKEVMLDAPVTVSDEQLKELHIKVVYPEKKEEKSIDKKAKKK